MSENRMSIRELTPLVERALRAAAEEFGLRPDPLLVEYVLNWGGFGTASFSVRDGKRRLRAKLTADAEQKCELRRWQSIHDVLEQHYHAPPMVGWLTIEGTAYEGPVFELIDGVFLDGLRMPNVVAEVLDCVERLHADAGLAQRLEANATVSSHLDRLLARAQMLRAGQTLCGAAANNRARRLSASARRDIESRFPERHAVVPSCILLLRRNFRRATSCVRRVQFSSRHFCLARFSNGDSQKLNHPPRRPDRDPVYAT